MIFVLWSLIFISSMIVSTFIHELGHGFSAKKAGYDISTGFNKVGDIYKKPSEVDFREDQDERIDILDVGVTITWLLGIIFTILSIKVNNQYLFLILAGFAYVNGWGRLLPCFNIFMTYYKKRIWYVEDEMGLGIALEKRFRIKLLKFIPLLISTIISIIIITVTTTLLIREVPELFKIDYLFTLVVVVSIFVSFKILEYLDERVRINWKGKQL